MESDIRSAAPVTSSRGVGRFTRGLGGLYLRLSGWRVEGRFPDAAKAVVIAAPHTSNWDLPLMLAVAYVLGIRPAWLGKRELFRWPFGWLMRRLGGLPVDRGARQNLVQQAVDRFDAVDRLHLVIPPSGTRSRATYWRSGFYHIARGATAPLPGAQRHEGGQGGSEGGRTGPTRHQPDVDGHRIVEPVATGETEGSRVPTPTTWPTRRTRKDRTMASQSSRTSRAATGRTATC